MAGPTSALAATTGIAAAMAFAPLGVTLETLMLGGLCFFGGSCARTGLTLYRQLDAAGSVSYGREVAKLLCTVPLAAVASCIIFMGAHVAGVNADTACGGVLLVMGVKGPDGFVWLTDRFTDVFTKLMPGGKPGGGA